MSNKNSWAEELNKDNTTAQKANIRVVAKKEKTPTRRLNAYIPEALFQRLLKHEFEKKSSGESVTHSSILADALDAYLA